MEDTIPLAEAKSFLQQAYRRGKGLTRQERRVLLKTCLAYLCKDMKRKQRQALITELARDSGLPVKVETEDRDNDQGMSAAQQAVLQRLLHMYYGEHLSDDDYPALFNTMLSELDQGLRSLCGVKGRKAMPWRTMLARSNTDNDGVEHAMQQAANESFERILGALNPEAMKHGAERKKWQIVALYKAELYDAMVEKYGQLKAYHEKGRLVRDFRSLYRMYYKQNTHNTESP